MSFKNTPKNRALLLQLAKVTVAVVLAEIICEFSGSQLCLHGSKAEAVNGHLHFAN